MGMLKRGGGGALQQELLAVDTGGDPCRSNGKGTDASLGSRYEDLGADKSRRARSPSRSPSRSAALGLTCVAAVLVLLLWRSDAIGSSGKVPGLRSWQGGGSATSVPVTLVEQHGEVLQYWVAALEDGSTASRAPPRGGDVMVVHVDTHSDYMDVGEAPQVYKRRWAKRGAAMEEQLMRNPSIGDFITRALFSRLVNLVYFVRSDFELGEYNGPAPGRYRGVVGIMSPLAPDVDDDGDAVVEPMEVEEEEEEQEEQEEEEGQGQDQDQGEEEQDEEPASSDSEDDLDADEDEDGNDSTVLCMGRMKLMERWTGTLRNEQAIEGFGRCARTVRKRDKRFELLVSTTETMMAPKGRVDAWILDIDLDFFSALDPSVALFAAHGFDYAFVEKCFLAAFTCSSDLETTNLRQLKMVMGQLALKRAVLDVDLVQKLFRVAGGSCKILARPKVAKLVERVRAFSADQVQQWTALWRQDISSWTGDFMSAFVDAGSDTSPQGVLTDIGIRAEAAKLERALAGLRDRFGAPACITVSRSQVEDHYLPPEQAPLIQAVVFQMLRNLFPGQLQPTHYHSDVQDQFKTVPGAEPLESPS